MTQNSHTLKGIIFDKDGTLFDYATVWAQVLVQSIENSFATMGKEDHPKAKSAMLTMLGIDPDGNAIPDGLVFSHSKGKILGRFLLFCLRYRINAAKAFGTYMTNLRNCEHLIEKRLRSMDFTVQQELFDRLRNTGYRIGIITSDTESSTRLFLREMGLAEKVDFVCARDSGCKRKPHPQAFELFCRKFGMEQDQVAVVGDTVTDMLFAKRAGAGYRIAVLSGSNDRKRLSPASDAIYDDISCLARDKTIFPA
jgi:phosphoglycolate phosphatase